MSDIKIYGVIEFDLSPKVSIKGLFNTLRQNLLAGSYQDYSSDLLNLLGDDIKHALDPRSTNSRLIHIKDGDYSFEFSLPSRYFPIDSEGDVHLMDSIIGDMFSIQSSSAIKKIHITHIEWRALDESLKLKRSTPRHIRSTFELTKYQPLLGFSVKPRLGLKDEEFFDRCKEVAVNGFNIIEPDTRKMLLSEYDLDKHIEFAGAIAGLNGVYKHKCGYSVNLSNYSGDIYKAIEKLSDVVRGAPLVVKVDLGVNSLWRIKLIKEVRWDAIITSYPLIKKTLLGRIPSNFFDKVLSNKGVDIMYPGGFVALPGNMRSYNATEDVTHLTESVYEYSGHVKSSQFVPTLTGGVSVGLLHLYYELYGPQVGLFIGGAVSTNKKGIDAGSKLCAKIIEFACAQRKKHSVYEDIELPDSALVKQIKEETGSDYIIPQEFIKAHDLGGFVDANWALWTDDSFEFMQ